MDTAAVILAAGQGKRMKSDLPKVLHTISDRPMVSYVIDAVRGFSDGKIILVIGHQADRVREAVGNEGVGFVLQAEQLGTGHAVMQCEEALADFDGNLMVLNGDVPCLQTATLRDFVAFHREQHAAGTVLTAELSDATGYGRIVRGPDESLLRIVEHKDASPDELEIREINSGLFCFDKKALFDALHGVDQDNAQGEYYITDVIELMRAGGQVVAAYRVEDENEVSGVNDVDELDAIRRQFEERDR
jgi:bifunctional UDP-N-acetylglucosamine pyrophosphorylase/glucosamine-1-phosphate N-acetyltransferase